MVYEVIRRAFYLEQWQIGWSRAKISDFLESPAEVDFNWISPDNKTQILADPFGLETESRLDIYAERLIHGQRGQIIQLNTLQPTIEASRLAKNWHLSYPFIVSHDGRNYAVPEQNEAGHLAFYPLDSKGAIRAESVAKIEGMAVLDATFLLHDGYWWLFAASPNIGSGQEGLLLFFSNDLMGPYTAHPANPIVSDPSCARPAGRIISLGGRLFRPGQDCSVGYGDAIRISEITKISTTAYAETIVKRIVPCDLKGAFPLGCHHLDHTANYVLVDSKRLIFCWYAWWLKLRSLMRRLLRKDGLR